MLPLVAEATAEEKTKQLQGPTASHVALKTCAVDGTLKPQESFTLSPPGPVATW